MKVKEMEKEQRYALLQERLQAGLTDIERDFLGASEIGDFETVRNLAESGKVSVTCTDLLGRTALDLAVITNDEEIVRFLLPKYPDHSVHKGLLCAVDNERNKLCEIILTHPLYNAENEILDGSQRQLKKVAKGRKSSGSQLLREALIQAAIRNNFQIVKMLMLKGVFLDPPHDYFCSCDKCTLGREGDFMIYTARRLDAFRAIASPAYIALTEEDPIVTAFYLSQKFRRLAELEMEYKQVYFELDTQVQGFTIDLLEQCHTSEEVRTLLGGQRDRNLDGADDIGLPVMNLAIRLDQKKFIAHYKCQAQVAQLWFSGVPLLRQLNQFSYLMMSIPVGMVMIPILSAVYLVAPWSKVRLILDTPIMRFLSYTTSYLTFLVLMIVSKLNLSLAWASLSCEEPEKIGVAFVVLLLMWILGLIWEETKQLWNAGGRDYFGSLWNIIDSTMLSFLLASFTLEIVTPLRLRKLYAEEVANDSSSNATLLINSVCAQIKQSSASSDIYTCTLPNQPILRVEWEPAWIPDPELVSDVLFSFGIVLSISRISFIMPCNETFGTMLVSFRRTIADLFKLCAMFILVLVSFTCGLAALYDANHCRTEKFKDVGTTFGVLLWTMFGMGEADAPALPRDGKMHSMTNNPSRNRTDITVGYILYGTFVFASTIVLMNLLIAVMSNTFQEIQDEQEAEWKHSRTELWLAFIEPGCPVPPPFNIVPNPKTVWHYVKKFINKARKRTEEGVGTDRAPAQVVEKVGRQEIISVLVRRYVRYAEKEKVEGDDDASEDMLRRMIERVSSKIEARIDKLGENLGKLGTNMGEVENKQTGISTIQDKHMQLTNEQLTKIDGILKKLDRLSQGAASPRLAKSSEDDDDEPIPKTKI